MASPRLTPDDIRALTDGVQDLVGEIRRLSDKSTDGAARLEGVHTRLDALTAAVQRLESQHTTTAFARFLGTLERAPWQVGALLAASIVAIILMAGHVDLVALAAAYSQPKGSP